MNILITHLIIIHGNKKKVPHKKRAESVCCDTFVPISKSGNFKPLQAVWNGQDKHTLTPPIVTGQVTSASWT